VADEAVKYRLVAILGLGLLGSSMARALRARGLCEGIIGWSPRESTREEALNHKLVDATVDSPEQAVAEADLVVAATPVSHIVKLIGAISKSTTNGTIVTDVGSTKRSITDAGDKHLPGRFVGSHPMAGGEKSGLAASRADLFQNAPCIITPTESTHRAAVDRIEKLWTDLGCRVTRMGPLEHDRLMADVSHLPHAIAAAVVAIQEERALGIAGNGFRDTTRVAAGDPQLWRDIFIDNRDAACRSIDRCVAWLRDFRTALQAGDGQRIESMLAAAAKRRAGM
jgi:prephenate dehydrogenase